MTENFADFLKKYGLTDAQIIEIIREFQKQFTLEMKEALFDLGWDKTAVELKVTSKEWLKTHEIGVR